MYHYSHKTTQQPGWYAREQERYLRAALGDTLFDALERIEKKNTVNTQQTHPQKPLSRKK